MNRLLPLLAVLLFVSGCQFSVSDGSKNGGGGGNNDPDLKECGTGELNYQPVKGQTYTAIPNVTKPAKGTQYIEPTYGTCMVRVTNHDAEAPSGFARNDYSRRQAFNVDNTRLIIYAQDGFWHLYDAQSYAWLRVLNGLAADAEPHWHPTNPDLLYFIPNLGGMVVNLLNVETNEFTEAANFTGLLPWNDAARVWTKSEGSPSADARYWGFQVETSSFAPLGLMVWDMVNQEVVGTFDFVTDGGGVGRPDHVSMSPSGDYLVASWDGNDYGTTAFYRDFSSQVKVHHKSEHSDIALMPDGNDAYIAVDYQTNGGDVFYHVLQTGERNALFTSYYGGKGTAFHFSGKGFNKPGWALVSTYSHNPAEAWLHRKIFAVSLTATPTIVQLGHHHSNVPMSGGYFAEPHASVNRDFTRVMFTSNWEAAEGEHNDVDAYMLKFTSSDF